VFLRLALKVVTQNDGDFLDVIPLYMHIAGGIISMLGKMRSDV
jgi:hypothetical protein